jgi:hypothetical protein
MLGGWRKDKNYGKCISNPRKNESMLNINSQKRKIN